MIICNEQPIARTSCRTWSSRKSPGATPPWPPRRLLCVGFSGKTPHLWTTQRCLFAWWTCVPPLVDQVLKYFFYSCYWEKLCSRIITYVNLQNVPKVLDVCRNPIRQHCTHIALQWSPTLVHSSGLQTADHAAFRALVNERYMYS